MRSTLGCHEPHCFITLHLSAASISVTARLTIPSATAADASTTAAAVASTTAAVESAATRLVGQAPSAISTSLGVTVTAAAPVYVRGPAVVPIVVAPPPPRPPSPSPPPYPPPTIPSASAGATAANSTLDDALDAVTAGTGTNSSNGGAAGTDAVVVASAVGACTVLALALLALFSIRRRRRKRSARPKRSMMRSMADLGSNLELHPTAAGASDASPPPRSPVRGPAGRHGVGRGDETSTGSGERGVEGGAETREVEFEVPSWSPGSRTRSPGLLPSSHEEVLFSTRVSRLESMLRPASQWILHTPGQLMPIAADSELRISKARLYLQVAGGARGARGAADPDGPLEQWPLSSLRGLKRRRYELQHTAVELAFSSGGGGATTSLVLNFESHEDRERVVRDLQARTKLIPPDDLLERFTEQWRDGSMDNFTYLMHLNDCASRTLYDLSQYPIM